MSNVNGLQYLKNNPRRNGFDLSSMNKYTAKVGQLLPVLSLEVLPGDKFRINLDNFTRTMPLNTAAYTWIKEHFDFFFVPYSQLWNNFDSFINKVPNQRTTYSYSSPSNDGTPTSVAGVTLGNLVSGLGESIYNAVYKAQGGTGTSATVPFSIGRDAAGMNRLATSQTLLSMLDYGVAPVYASMKSAFPMLLNDGGVIANSSEFVSTSYRDSALGVGLFYDSASYTPYNVRVNLLKLFAYQKIYADFYRNDVWEQAQPISYNMDFTQLGTGGALLPSSYDFTDADLVTPFEMRYRDFAKDLYMGLLPNSQYGSSTATFSSNFYYGDTVVGQAVRLANDQYINTNEGRSFPFFGPANYELFSRPTSVSIEGSVLDLRKAQALQRYLEIAGSAGDDAEAQIAKHFGVEPKRTYKVRYLGSKESTVNINEVINNNLGESDSQANIKGLGYSSVNNGNTIEFSSENEYGLLMCIYSAEPKVDYQMFFDFINGKSSYTDFAIPEMDSIGLQAVMSTYFGIMGKYSDVTTIGYAPRYIEYKTAVNKVHGAFLDSLSSWVPQFTQDSFVKQNTTDYRRSKISPAYLDNLFLAHAGSSSDSDQLLVYTDFDVKAVRNLDFNGLPF